MVNDFYPEKVIRELKKIDSIKATFDNYFSQDWIQLKHQEDFDQIYKLDKTIKFKIENIYPEGQSISHDIRFDLEYNYIEKFPTITIFINEFRNKYTKNLKKIKKVSSDVQKLVNDNNVNIWAVKAMIRLYNEQVQLIENIEQIFKTIENTDYYLKENPSFINRVKRHKIVSFFISISIIVLGMLTYVDDVSSKVQNISKVFSPSKKSISNEMFIQLSKIQSELKQTKYIYDSFNPTPDFHSQDKALLTFNKINKFQKDMNSVFDTAQLHRIIKEYGNKQTKKKFKIYLKEVHDNGKNLTLYIVNIINSDGIKNNDELIKVTNEYIKKLNLLTESFAKYHGFIDGLTKKDFTEP